MSAGRASCETRVKPDTPPVFIWHTVSDTSVPVENSILFAFALRKNNIPFAMHLFQNGRHGLGLRPEAPDEVKKWPDLCLTWLHSQKIL